MRVFAVAQLLQLGELKVEFLAPRAGFSLAVEPAQVVGDSAVVARGVVEGLAGKPETGFSRQLAIAGQELVGHQRVIRRLHHHRHVRMILGRGPDHGGAADVDLLDDLVERRLPRHRGLERVQVHHHHVDGVDAQLFHLGAVLRLVPEGQDAAVDLGVERLDPAVHDFREPGDIRHLGHVDAVLSQQCGGPSRGQDLDAQSRQLFGKIDDTVLLGYANQRSFDLTHGCRIPPCCGSNAHRVSDSRRSRFSGVLDRSRFFFCRARVAGSSWSRM